MVGDNEPLLAQSRTRGAQWDRVRLTCRALSGCALWAFGRWSVDERPQRASCGRCSGGFSVRCGLRGGCKHPAQREGATRSLSDRASSPSSRKGIGVCAVLAYFAWRGPCAAVAQWVRSLRCRCRSRLPPGAPTLDQGAANPTAVAPPLSSPPFAEAASCGGGGRGLRHCLCDAPAEARVGPAPGGFGFETKEFGAKTPSLLGAPPPEVRGLTGGLGRGRIVEGVGARLVVV